MSNLKEFIEDNTFRVRATIHKDILEDSNSNRGSLIDKQLRHNLAEELATAILNKYEGFIKKDTLMDSMTYEICVVAVPKEDFINRLNIPKYKTVCKSLNNRIYRSGVLDTLDDNEYASIVNDLRNI